jgi:hypothetical protein
MSGNYWLIQIRRIACCPLNNHIAKQAKTRRDRNNFFGFIFFRDKEKRTAARTIWEKKHADYITFEFDFALTWTKQQRYEKPISFPAKSLV